MSKEKFKFSAPVRVRFIETDAAGIVHHAAFCAYMEVGRVEYFRHIGAPFHEINKRVTLTIAHIECDYKGRAYFDDLLRVYTRMDRIGTSSFTTIYEIRREDDDALIALCNTVHVVLDMETNKPIPVPDFMVKPIEGFEGASLRGGSSGQT